MSKRLCGADHDGPCGAELEAAFQVNEPDEDMMCVEDCACKGENLARTCKSEPGCSTCIVAIVVDHDALKRALRAGGASVNGGGNEQSLMQRMMKEWVN